MRRPDRFVCSFALAVFAVEFPFNSLEAQGKPLLNVSPAAISLNYLVGTPPPIQSLEITSSGTPSTYRVSTTTASGGNWLFAGPVLAGTGTLGVGLNPSPIVGPGSAYPLPGTYSGSVILTARLILFPYEGSAAEVAASARKLRSID